jgi:chromosome segregation ATPase
VLANAESALVHAEHEAGQKRRQLDEARERRDRCGEQVADLERQLRALRKTEEAADDEVRAAKTALDSAERAVITARDELVRSQSVIEQTSSSRA